MLINKKTLFLLLLFHSLSFSYVDLVIYSMNRPMQVYALLESIKSNIQGAGQIYVLFRASDETFAFGYQEVRKYFPEVFFVQQDHALDGNDFKELHFKCAFESPHDYVSFIVDDCIVKEPVNLCECTKALETIQNSFGFFLRLGRDIAECYQSKTKTPPPCVYSEDKFYVWQFKTAMKDVPGWGALTLGDWNFATSNDFSIYRKRDIRPFFEHCDYKNTSYESAWWYDFRSKQENMEKLGICFKTSKIVNVCVNIANDTMANWGQFSIHWQKKLQEYSVNSLLKKFMDGYKIDIQDISRVKHAAPHVEYEYKFIER